MQVYSSRVHFARCIFDHMTRTPEAPTHQPVQLRGDYSRAANDYTVPQDWEHYTQEDHEIWKTLYARQIRLLERYAAPEFIAGTKALAAPPEGPAVEERIAQVARQRRADAHGERPGDQQGNRGEQQADDYGRAVDGRPDGHPQAAPADDSTLAGA